MNLLVAVQKRTSKSQKEINMTKFAEDMPIKCSDDKQKPLARDYYYYSHTINLARP